ncbi:MAG TPA: transcription termination/antitermination protein NusG [Candidatus Megaira endosymbiont of Nemacystus decipiens]|nr:transcription termination/antitermination protein NusG [Candidatus Megaera endosymbiont of Nemacystus decipiens]
MANWYILYTASGTEKKVKRKIEEQVQKNQMSDDFEDIIVPVIEVPEIRKGKKVVAEKKMMSGYILIKMNMTDKAWHLVKSVPGAVGFLGSKNKPQPLNNQEAETMFEQLQMHAKSASEASVYNAGDKVRVIDGPFDTFSGVIEEVDMLNQTVKVSFLIFGKATPIELNFNQIKKD